MNVTQKIVQQISKHSPLILTTAGVVGIFVTAAFAGKATLEANEVVKRLEKTIGEPITKREIVEATWKFYIPTVLIGVATSACIVGTHNIHNRRYAGLVSVYSMTELALREYKDKVVTTIGENKERKIREAIDQDHLDANPVTKTEVIITGPGQMLCYESITGRYFKSDMETLRKAQNDINAHIIQHMYASHNEFCSLVGLPTTTLGDQLGWTVETMMDSIYSSMLSDNGEPCLVLDYRIAPESDYFKLH